MSLYFAELQSFGVSACRSKAEGLCKWLQSRCRVCRVYPPEVSYKCVTVLASKVRCGAGNLEAGNGGVKSTGKLGWNAGKLG